MLLICRVAVVFESRYTKPILAAYPIQDPSIAVTIKLRVWLLSQSICFSNASVSDVLRDPQGRLRRASST